MSAVRPARVEDKKEAQGLSFRSMEAFKDYFDREDGRRLLLVERDGGTSLEAVMQIPDPEAAYVKTLFELQPTIFPSCITISTEGHKSRLLSALCVALKYNNIPAAAFLIDEQIDQTSLLSARILGAVLKDNSKPSPALHFICKRVVPEQKRSQQESKTPEHLASALGMVQIAEHVGDDLLLKLSEFVLENLKNAVLSGEFDYFKAVCDKLKATVLSHVDATAAKSVINALIMAISRSPVPGVPLEAFSLLTKSISQASAHDEWHSFAQSTVDLWAESKESPIRDALLKVVIASMAVPVKGDQEKALEALASKAGDCFHQSRFVNYLNILTSIYKESRNDKGMVTLLNRVCSGAINEKKLAEFFRVIAKEYPDVFTKGLTSFLAGRQQPAPKIDLTLCIQKRHITVAKALIEISPNLVTSSAFAPAFNYKDGFCKPDPEFVKLVVDTLRDMKLSLKKTDLHLVMNANDLPLARRLITELGVKCDPVELVNLKDKGSVRHQVALELVKFGQGHVGLIPLMLQDDDFFSACMRYDYMKKHFIEQPHAAAQLIHGLFSRGKSLEAMKIFALAPDSAWSAAVSAKLTELNANHGERKESKVSAAQPLPGLAPRR